ncbi:MAG: Gfo/Idh/MocA family oxidoreductase [Verrucomicrobia bacterium]|nr:Gfo/Idh/MocA family oxidoreductase [Verrucomicrobiota bacterium]
MAPELRIGVTGAGQLGTHLAAAARDAGAAVVAVHDIRREAADTLAAAHAGAIATTDIDAFFAVAMDGLLVCTVPPVRVDPVTRACAKGIHLLIEKPPAYDLTAGRECLAAIEKADVMAAVGFQLRYDPRYERLKALIEGHDVHLVRTVCTINYYLDFAMSPWFLQKAISGGPIAEQAIHLLDCVRFVLGNPRPTRAAAIGARNMALDRDEFDAENALQVMYELDNGVFGVHTNHCGHETFHFDLELIGPHLRLHANITEATIRGVVDGEPVEVTPPARSALGLDKVGAWLKAIETGDRSYLRSEFAEALQTLALVDAAIKSQSTGKIEEAESIAAIAPMTP